MRKKIMYLLLLICGMSIFSAARYTGRSCDKKTTTYKAEEAVCEKKKAVDNSLLGFDLLLQRFL
jgi:hypothetical protein